MGYTRDDLLRLPMSAVHPNEMPALIEFAKKVWDTGPRRSDEFSCLTKSGVSVPAELSASPIEVEGRSLLLVYARDISQRREIEAQLYQAQKMEMVGQLTGGVAHDFNNLLAHIMMSLEILMETCGDRADAVELINKAIETTEKGATLTHRLLAFSRKQVLAPKFISVNGLIGGMLDMLRRTLGETVEIQTPLDEDASKTLIDPAQLESAVLNLAINARDAMPDGERLTIETENVDIDDEYAGSRSEVRPGPYVLLAVSDNGVGMSPRRSRQSSVLHHQGGGKGHRTGSKYGFWFREAVTGPRHYL